MKKSRPRTQQARTDATRQALIDAARALFVDQGYADTSTPAIVEAAGITRGALYHHFADKRALFRAVLMREAEAVAADIVAATPPALPAVEGLRAGGRAYLASMCVPGRTRLLLVDGPAALGPGEMDEIDASNAARTLREGLAEAMGDAPSVSLDALASLLSAAFDRAALDIDGGADADTVQSAVDWMLGRLLAR